MITIDRLGTSITRLNRIQCEQLNTICERAIAGTKSVIAIYTKSHRIHL